MTLNTTLPDLCERFFQHMCRLNRSARRRVGQSFSRRDQPATAWDWQVRSEINALFADMKTKATAVPGLAVRWNKVRPALLTFCDYTITHSALPFAGEWKPLYKGDPKNPHADPDREFFETLDATLREPGHDAEERLQVFYTCIGLGYKGPYANMPQELQKRMKQIGTRLRTSMGMVDDERITGEAYDYTDTGNLIEPVRASLTPVVLVLLGLTVVLLAVNIAFYYDASEELRTILGSNNVHPSTESVDRPSGNKQ